MHATMQANLGKKTFRDDNHTQKEQICVILLIGETQQVDPKDRGKDLECAQVPVWDDDLLLGMEPR